MEGRRQGAGRPGKKGMSDNHLTTREYRDWLKEIKQRLRQAQVKAAVQVNVALLTFYWELGADIVERQKTAQWGSGFLKQLSADLMAEFPDIKGFSKRNLERIRMWYLFYSQGVPNCDTACGTNGRDSKSATGCCTFSADSVESQSDHHL